MKEAGLQPDGLVYGNVMGACARNGRAQTVLQLHAQMKADGLEVDAFAYNAAVTAASRSRRWRQAISMMDEMEEEARRRNDPSVMPTHHTYNSVLRACAEAGQARAAQSLLSRMLRNGVEPSSFHFGNVISACARGGELRRVMMYMTQMQQRGLQPDKKTFTTCLSACARENQLNRALSLIERMYKLEVAPDVATYNVLLQACDKQSKFDVIYQLIESMPELGVEPNLVNYNTAVRSLCRGADADYKHAASLLSKMRQRDVAPTFSTYRAAINGSATGGHLDRARALVGEMKAAGFEPDLHVQYAVLAACGDDEAALAKVEKELQCTADVVRRTAWPPPAYDQRGGRGWGAAAAAEGAGRGRGGGRGRGAAEEGGIPARGRHGGSAPLQGRTGPRRRRGRRARRHPGPAGCDGAGGGGRERPDNRTARWVESS